MFQLCNWHMLWFVSEGRTLVFSFKDTNSLDLLICMYFEQVCLWLLRTVCNVSNDFHSHAFQLSLGLPLFFQILWHGFKSQSGTISKSPYGLIVRPCEEPQDTCGQHMRKWCDGSVKSGHIKWPGSFNLLWKFYGFILTVQAAWDCFSKQV